MTGDRAGDGGRGLATALLRHFDLHSRDLPWRATGDPYAIWVSEVMLQQTRVETAAPYFERWMHRFPTLDALADASLDEVLGTWQGLGYYSRARNLHRAALLVRERHGGRVPDDPARLRALPGVGEYTAGAVASIAFGVAVPAVDGNVRRVLSRLFDRTDPTGGELRALAGSLVPADRPGDFNQALMELGATVCTPRSPRCADCPVARWCQARAAGVQEERPRRKRRAAIPHATEETAVVVRGDGRALLVRRPEEGLLGGMWEFPGADRPAWLAALVASATPTRQLEPVTHVFSHRKITYLPTVFRVTEPADGPPGGGWAWVNAEETAGYALPAAQRRMARQALGTLVSA